MSLGRLTPVPTGGVSWADLADLSLGSGLLRPRCPLPPPHTALAWGDLMIPDLFLWNKSDEFNPLDSPENTPCYSLVCRVLAQAKDSGRVRVARGPSVSAARSLATGRGRLWPSAHPQRSSPLLILPAPGKSLSSPVPGKAASPCLWGLKTSVSESFVTSALDLPLDLPACVPSRLLQLGFALSLVSAWDQGRRGVFFPSHGPRNCVPLFSTYAAPS